MILGLVDEAVAGGARQEKACELIGIDVRALQRWRKQGIGEDRRAGPISAPKNKISEAERQEVLKVANLPEHRDLSPKQIVPKLADEGRFIASESTFYRILRLEGQVRHRERSHPAAHARPRELRATRPNQVWTWDITYLLSPVKGVYFYLYVVLDIFSRKIVGWAVHEEESGEHAVALITAACRREGVERNQLTLHQDNGAPMKCGTFLAALQWLGVAASFSRPGVSDDNPYSESNFRTLKYRPNYPDRPFASREDAESFITGFVHWYNHEHLHGNVKFVTPATRHGGHDGEVLAGRTKVYEHARERHPERWSRSIRNWKPIEEVFLNPRAEDRAESIA
jgi:transposase InsO family protein